LNQTEPVPQQPSPAQSSPFNTDRPEPSQDELTVKRLSQILRQEADTVDLADHQHLERAHRRTGSTNAPLTDANPVQASQDGVQVSENQLGFPCPRCRYTCRIVTAEAGQLTRCPNCNAKLIAPDPENGWEPILFENLMESMLGFKPDGTQTRVQPKALEANPTPDFAATEAAAPSPAPVAPPPHPPETYHSGVTQPSPFSFSDQEGSPPTPPRNLPTDPVALAEQPQPHQQEPVAGSPPQNLPSNIPATPVQPEEERPFPGLLGPAASVQAAEAVDSRPMLSADFKSPPSEPSAFSPQTATRELSEVTYNPSDHDPNPENGLTTKAFLRFCAIVGLIAAICIGLVLADKVKKDSAVREHKAKLKIIPKTDITYDLEFAETFLRKAFDAPDLNTRLPFFSDTQGHESQIQRVFEKPDALKLEDVKYMRSNITRERKVAQHFYQIRTSRNPALSGVIVVNRNGKFSIPWPAFYQFHEGTLTTFASEKGTTAENFSVFLKRAHKFGPVPGVPDNWEKFTLTGSLDQKIKIIAYANPETESLVAPLESMGWTKSFQVVATLQHVHPQPDGPQFEPFLAIREIVRIGW